MNWHIIGRLIFGIGLILNAVLMLVRPDFRISPMAVLVVGIFILLDVVRFKV